MRLSTIAIFASTFLYQIHAASASSVLIEKTGGAAVARVLPSDACPIHIQVVNAQAATNRVQNLFFKPVGGLAISATRIPHVGTQWKVATNNVDQNIVGDVYFRGNFPGNGNLGIDPGQKCSGYISSSEDAKFLDVPLGEIDRLSFFDEDAGANGKLLDLDKKNVVWRKTVQPGTESHCGMVIEVKPPLVKVQTITGEKWFKTNQLYPVGIRSCNFLNGAYQE